MAKKEGREAAITVVLAHGGMERRGLNSPTTAQLNCQSSPSITVAKYMKIMENIFFG
jgi:hypothetical protein